MNRVERLAFKMMFLCVLGGCMNELACNYDSKLYSDGSCEFAQAPFDCNGDCINDADNDEFVTNSKLPVAPIQMHATLMLRHR